MLSTKSIGSLILAGCISTMTVVATPAAARDGRHAALFGGIAAGALLGSVFAGSAFSAPAYATPSYGYESYDEPIVVRHCWRERQPVYDDWGDFVGYRQRRACD